MKKASLIGHVIELYDEVRTLKQPADVSTGDFFRARHYLGSRDRRFITETIYGMLRNALLLDACSRVAMVAHPYVMTALPSLLLYATYAVRIAGEPPSEVLPEISGLWGIYVRDVPCDAFLQGVAAVDPLSLVPNDDTQRLSILHSMPEFLVCEWVGRYGAVQAEQLCAAMNQPAPTTLRVNTLRATREQCSEMLSREGVETSPTALSPVGLKAVKRFNAQSLRSFKEGIFELQDEGSQLLSLLAEARPGMTVVDACAGGGGKTLHLAAIMENRGRLLAIDVQIRRLNNIRERLHRAGVVIADVLLAGRDQQAILKLTKAADVALVDAPCSGSGTLRRNPATKLLLTEEMVAPMRATQRLVLETYAALVRPGGRLIYSTCSMIESENETIVSEFLKHQPDFQLISAPEILRGQGINIPAEGNHMTLLPHLTTTDGFFAAVMHRVGSAEFIDS